MSGRGKASGKKAVSRSAKAGLQFPVGVPIGSEAFTTAAVRAKLEIHVQHLDTLPQLQDSQVALPMLTRCYV
jgi:hypothetical protein